MQSQCLTTGPQKSLLLYGYTNDFFSLVEPEDCCTSILIKFCSSQALPGIEQLVEKAKKALAKSVTLRRFISKGFCDCFLMASMCEIEGTSDTTQMNYIDIRQQRNEVLRKACTSDIHEVTF